MIKSACDCCGTCCRKGGPALHTADRELVLSHQLSFGDLITIRQGEYVLHPVSDEPQPAEEEFLKIQGREGEWCCTFLDSKSSTCTIYTSRPLACRLLRCWDPDELLEITGKELINRFDYISESNPMFRIMKMHEKSCPVPDIASLPSRLSGKKLRGETLTALTWLVNHDLQIRSGAVRKFQLSLPDELFYFGRPIFQLLAPAEISVEESPQGLNLQFTNT